MKIDVLTLFPGMFEGFFNTSIIGKAREKNLVSLHTINFRDYAANKHHTVDDTPYGGGGGMVLKPEPIFHAVESVVAQTEQNKQPRIILMSPQGETFSQQKADELSQEAHLIFICGHYEGYDERIREHLVTDEISIGDYVLTGGEIPAMAVIDSVVRLLPSVLGNKHSAVDDSFSTGLLEYPHYTRPAKFREWEVPEILISGHHDNIDKWRREQALLRTWMRRPDLIEQVSLTKEEKAWLAQMKRKNKDD